MLLSFVRNAFSSTVTSAYGKQYLFFRAFAREATGIQQQLIDAHPKDDVTNIPVSLKEKLSKKLHLQPSHPLSILRCWMEEYFAHCKGVHRPFKAFNTLPATVNTWQNFDSLRIPEDHPSRSAHDTYYVNKDKVLRTHTSAHECDLLQRESSILVSGDVYRRDEIDASHYPVFHQMEGACVIDKEELRQHYSSGSLESCMEKELKCTLEGLVQSLFARRSDLTEQLPMRWVESYFPFTLPSWELEIFYNNAWLEVLGCGLHHPQVLLNANRQPEKEIGWAFGIGLERVAMTLFSIPDIRLFWSEDQRFLSQFKNITDKAVTFVPFSKYPACYKDVSMWLTSSNVHNNDVFEIIRNVAGDLVENVQLLDTFQQNGKESRCYRIAYRSMERSMTNEEINRLQDDVRDSLVSHLGAVLR